MGLLVVFFIILKNNAPGIASESGANQSSNLCDAKQINYNLHLHIIKRTLFFSLFFFH